MATNAELEAQLLSGLAKQPDVKLAKALLSDPPQRSDTALPWLRLALGVVSAGGGRPELAWLTKLAATSKRSWPATWMRDWFLQSIASTAALITRLHDGPVKPVKVTALPSKPHLRWLALAGEQDFAQLEALLADFTDGPATQIAERAQALLGWPKDRRIARAALTAHQGRLVSNPMHPIWNALGNLIAVHADAELRRSLSEDPSLAGPHWISHWRGGAEVAPRKAAERSNRAPQTPEEWERWVLEAPEDPARRALWSDWLLERDDPRGQLLALQLADRALTPKEESKVASLVRKHGRTWIGKFTGFVELKELEFDRGVLVGIRALSVPDGRIPAEDPHWRAGAARLGLGAHRDRLWLPPHARRQEVAAGGDRHPGEVGHRRRLVLVREKAPPLAESGACAQLCGGEADGAEELPTTAEAGGEARCRARAPSGVEKKSSAAERASAARAAVPLSSGSCRP